MNNSLLNLLSQSSDHRIVYEISPRLPMSDAWHWLIFAIVCVVLVGIIVALYRRDSVELPLSKCVLLIGLRIAAVALLATFFLHPQKRTETRLVKNSNLAVLIDTSLSMGLSDQDVGSGNRLEQVADLLDNTEVLESLAAVHDLNVYRFDNSSQPQLIAKFKKPIVASPDSANVKDSRDVENSRFASLAATVLFAFGFVFIISYFFFKLRSRNKHSRESGEPRESKPPSGAGWLQTIGLGICLISLLMFAVADLVSPKDNLWSFAGSQAPTESALMAKTKNENEEGPNIDWSSVLIPKGTETQIGQAIQTILNKSQDDTLAGVIVITDGCSNAGADPSRAVALATAQGVPLYPVGIGSTQSPKSLSVSKIKVSPRVLPNVEFKVQGWIRCYGVQEESIQIELTSASTDEESSEQIEDTKSVKVKNGSEPVYIEFNVKVPDEGRRRFTIRIGDAINDDDKSDNQRSSTVVVIKKKTKVLLIGGGPMRDFRFLRNQLFRDDEITLDVWLQNAKRGADQESDNLLFEFPKLRRHLFEYDCIVAFDPDWRRISAEQSGWLERWVAEKAGGLIVIAGPIFTPEWTRHPRGDKAIDKIRQLYPVSFYNQGSAVLKIGRFGGSRAFPLQFTRAGKASEFLWLGDSSSESLMNWRRFQGVFGYYAVNEAKPGAEILSYFADSTTSIDGKLPIYMASQFYGAGRVFFQASGESWRMRRIDVRYFEQYYTKLVRWASQSRLLRESSRGVLMVDRENCWLGDQVTIDAILTDPQDDPYLAESVTMAVQDDSGNSRQLRLINMKNSVVPGTYRGDFVAEQEGQYRLSLPVPDSPESEVLTAEITVNIPDLERERPERNDQLLSTLADKTEGHFYAGTRAISLPNNDPLAPVNLIPVQDLESYLPGTPDRFFARKLMIWLLGILTTALCLEWVIRRLNRLA